MSERQQAEILLKNIPEQNLHIVIALMRELTEYEDYVECALDEADYLAEHTAERMTHEEVFSELRGGGCPCMSIHCGTCLSFMRI